MVLKHLNQPILIIKAPIVRFRQTPAEDHRKEAGRQSRIFCAFRVISWWQVWPWAQEQVVGGLSLGATAELPQVDFAENLILYYSIV